MSKPEGDPSSGISSEDVLIPTERHPACRQREARSGFRMERENLAGDDKGKGASGSNREAESTDAPERDGLLRSSDEAGVMLVERRGRVTDVDSGQPATGGTRQFNGRRQPSLGGTSRMMREYQVRICEGLGVKFPGPTRHSRRIDGLRHTSAVPPIAPGKRTWRQESYGPEADSCVAAKRAYSITSSARSRIDWGTVRPSALAVL